MKEKSQALCQLLLDAAAEIKQLRRANEVMAARLEMVYLMADANRPLSAPDRPLSAPDVVWAIEKYLAE